MNLTELAIRRNRITITIVVLLLVSGVLAYFALPKAQDPGFIVRTAVITTQLPGANPKRIELLVTDKIEKKIQEMPEIDSIVSESRTGISIINANFKESFKDMRPIFDDLRRKVEDISSVLPAGTQTPLVNDEFGDVFGSVYALSGEGFSYAELKDIADELRDRLLTDPDIAKVNIHGSQDEIIFAEYSNARLTELGLSPQQLAASLAGANILSSGGSILSGRERIALEPTGNFESVDDLAQTVVELPNGNVLYLRDIANIYRDYRDPPTSIARVNGDAALAIAISMREGGDILKLGERLDRTMPQLMSAYPWGIELKKIWFQADLVNASVDSFTSSLGQAIAIVVIVIVIFLGLRTGFVVATLIPTTMIITFYVMQLFEITINQISLAALIISLGLLVDNAIVIVESILVKREQGVPAVKAAVDSGSELATPLLISSLTTAAAFMPIALAESAVGEYTADIFYVVTIALLTSWLLAMSFLPMLSTSLLQVRRQEAQGVAFNSQWYQTYRKILLLCVTHRWQFALAVIAIFATALIGLGAVRQEFIAPSEDPVLTGKLEMPLGTSIETSQDRIGQLDEFIKDKYFQPIDGSEPLLKNWLVYIGEGGPRFTLALDPPNPNPANSFLIVDAVNGEVVTDIIAGIQAYLFAEHPDLSNQIARLENGPAVGYPIQIRISGDNFDDLYTIADSVTEMLYAESGVSAVKSTWGLQTKKLIVNVDQERARRAGVSSDDVAYSLNASLSGIDMTEYREDDNLIPVTLRTVQADRQDVNKLDGMAVYSQSSGRTVPLKQVADITLDFEPGIIERRDRIRTLTLLVQLREGITATDVNTEFLPKLDEYASTWPVRFSYEQGGEAESTEDSNAAIAAKLPIAIMSILLLLVFQFNSLRRPLIVLATIPLGIIGVTIGLLVADSSFGFFTILGIISLSGIIINNAIVLLDRIAINQENPDLSHQDTVITACLQRTRPILLATGTTVLGMMPLWWGGTAMFRPMAISIIFGLLFATLLTLLVVPVLYSALFRVDFKNYQTQT